MGSCSSTPLLRVYCGAEPSRRLQANPGRNLTTHALADKGTLAAESGERLMLMQRNQRRWRPEHHLAF